MAAVVARLNELCGLLAQTPSKHASPDLVQGPREILVVLLQLVLVHSACYFLITEPC